MYERARNVLTGGVASSYQLREPWPIYLEHGEGPRVWDVDGNEMYDFHNGFGSMVQGHAHPAIGKADRRALRPRAPTSPRRPRTRSSSPRSSPRRWGIHRWRYTNSGSESTMDAIRIARAYTKRDTVMKIFGSYHGHHDTVMVSIGVEYDQIGPRGLRLAALRRRHPAVGRRLTISGALQRRRARWSAGSTELDREGRKPACVIMEAAMMNLGVVLPEPGYLEAVREITRTPRHRADLRRGQDRPRASPPAAPPSASA